MAVGRAVGCVLVPFLLKACVRASDGVLGLVGSDGYGKGKDF